MNLKTQITKYELHSIPMSWLDYVAFSPGLSVTTFVGQNASLGEIRSQICGVWKTSARSRAKQWVHSSKGILFLFCFLGLKQIE